MTRDAFVVLGWKSTDDSSFCTREEEGFECCKYTVETPEMDTLSAPDNTASIKDDYSKEPSTTLSLDGEENENKEETAAALSQNFDIVNINRTNSKNISKPTETMNSDMAKDTKINTLDDEHIVNTLDSNDRKEESPFFSATPNSKDTASIHTAKTIPSEETLESSIASSTSDLRLESRSSQSLRPSSSSEVSLRPLLVRIEHANSDVYFQQRDRIRKEDSSASNNKSIECILPTIVFADQVILHDMSNIHSDVRSSSSSSSRCTNYRLDGIDVPEYLFVEYQNLTNFANMRPKLKHPQEQVMFDDDDPWAAAKRGDFMALQRFEATRNMDWTALDEAKHPPLYYACQSGADSDMESLRFLLRIWPTLNLPEDLIKKCKNDAINKHVIKLLDLADNPDMDTINVDQAVDDYDSPWGARARADVKHESCCDCELGLKDPLLSVLDKMCGGNSSNKNHLVNQAVEEDDTLCLEDEENLEFRESGDIKQKVLSRSLPT